MKNTQNVTRNAQQKTLLQGNILLCEDSHLNQQIMVEHLKRIGLTAEIANNGQECVDIVAQCIDSGKTPFDLIFMDIHMPIMNGIEAADRLNRMGNKSPVVALTANISEEDKQVYSAHGMIDSLPKPFTSEELWKCLSKYIRIAAVEHAPDLSKDDKFLKKLKTNFVKSNKNTCQTIIDSVNAGDIKRAYRIAHTLKSTAGLIGRPNLSQAAKSIEHSLDNGSELSQKQIDDLTREMDMVLSELAYLAEDVTTTPKKYDTIDKVKSNRLLDELEVLLCAYDSDCLDMVEQLTAIPGTEQLVSAMEDYEFAQAAQLIPSVRDAIDRYISSI